MRIPYHICKSCPDFGSNIKAASFIHSYCWISRTQSETLYKSKHILFIGKLKGPPSTSYIDDLTPHPITMEVPIEL